MTCHTTSEAVLYVWCCVAVLSMARVQALWYVTSLYTMLCGGQKLDSGLEAHLGTALFETYVALLLLLPLRLLLSQAVLPLHRD